MAAAHVKTIGVRRPGYGKGGRTLTVQTNHFVCKPPSAIISHYDVIEPSEKVLPARLNMDIIRILQTHVAPEVFTPRVVYDGRKNIFSPRTLSFGNVGHFEVSLTDTRTMNPKYVPGGGDKDKKGPGDSRGPKVYKVKLSKVAEINPEVLARYLVGKQSHDSTVLTAITALNVVIRMEPTINFPFNVRSFFTPSEQKDIGGGIVLWRGYFQSVRPAVGRLVINVDISTGAMYKGGPLLNLCLQHMELRHPRDLTRNGGFTDRYRFRLQRFLLGIRIVTRERTSGAAAGTPRVVKNVTVLSAREITFTLREGGSMTVEQYFQNTYNRKLQFPDLPCIEVGAGALLPMELCDVPEGQIMRKQIPPERTKAVLDFATQRPADRLKSITGGREVLAYDTSDYVRQFGMSINTAAPMKIDARVLAPPTLKYGQGSRQATVTPQQGAWNMVGRKFYRPCQVIEWVVLIYETTKRFDANASTDMIKGLREAATDVGIMGLHKKPLIIYRNGQANVVQQMLDLGKIAFDHFKCRPNLIVVVVPEQATDIYLQVKHAGDCKIGVATQCLKAQKCFRAKAQYFANVCLKINVKLGGVNTIPDTRSVNFLTDAINPAIVMGADVVHPAPGADGRPSFTSLVANLDSDCAKYVATSRVQTSRQELIDDLEEMTYQLLGKYMKYRRDTEKKSNIAPKRILFYRDGVSEGQFKAVLENEVARIKAACKRHKINPKLTFIVVGKRHHVRFFPTGKADDKSGNCPAGTVVDKEVTHPTEFDFYLQSHAGILGTSRPAHYNVLLDENTFTPDNLQLLSFALTHVYARATRSVSIPAPVYYADIVCARAKCHYAPRPDGGRPDQENSDDAMQLNSAQANLSLEYFKRNFWPISPRAEDTMYFS